MPPAWWWRCITQVARYARQRVPDLLDMSLEEFGFLYDAVAEILEAEAEQGGSTE